MPFSPMRKVKIVATLGPASNDREIIMKLAKAGVNIFRINLSHCKCEEAVETIRKIHYVEKNIGYPLATLIDLVGPKIRIGMTSPGAVLQAGQKIKIISKQVRESERYLTLNHPETLNYIQKGAEIYLGDGLITLIAERRIPNGISARVVVGGALSSRMGFSAQGLRMKASSLTDRDREAVKTMVVAGADALAISFVQSAKDVEAVRNLLPNNNHSPMLIAKIETRSGVENAEEIINAADGLMVARGDLGLAVSMAELPYIQKQLIALALKKAKPVITATQMLESMINNHLPTRAEVTDVATAVLDGTDAVMLSGETAVGKFPEAVINMAVNIINATTNQMTPRDFPVEEKELVADAISASVVKIADQVKARLIIVFTKSGATARRVACYRHLHPIIALSPELPTIRKLNFSWGILAQHITAKESFQSLMAIARKAAKFSKLIKLKKGDPFVISAGVPFGKSGTTNLIFVQRL